VVLAGERVSRLAALANCRHRLTLDKDRVVPILLQNSLMARANGDSLF
jgi:hypothetical protein